MHPISLGLQSNLGEGQSDACGYYIEKIVYKIEDEKRRSQKRRNVDVEHCWSPFACLSAVGSWLDCWVFLSDHFSLEEFPIHAFLTF
jgi:hypothetical protein